MLSIINMEILHFYSSNFLFTEISYLTLKCRMLSIINMEILHFYSPNFIFTISYLTLQVPNVKYT